MNYWTDEEIELLRGELHIDPQKSPPKRLCALVRHFVDGLSLWKITQGGGEPHVSKELGTKVRRLWRAGELDWVLERRFNGSDEQAAEQVSGNGLSVTVRVQAELFARQLQEHNRSLLAVIEDLESIDVLTFRGQELLPCG